MLGDFGNLVERVMQSQSFEPFIMEFRQSGPDSIQNDIMNEFNSEIDNIGQIFHQFLIRDTREPVLQSALGSVIYYLKSAEIHMDIIPPLMNALSREFRMMPDNDMKEAASIMNMASSG